MGFCASSASGSGASKPPSSVPSIPRSGSHAPYSLRARPSVAMCWYRASRRAGGSTTPRAGSPMGNHCPSSSPLFRSRPSKAQLLALYDRGHDPLGGKTAQEKLETLKRTSYRDYLVRVCGCSEEVANCFQGRTLGFFGLGCDAVPAADARELGYPGFDGLGLPGRSAREPYIYHFPDGNASLARLLVRSLVPEVAPGQTMDDVVLARFDYDKLDRSGQGVRIRLESTCV